MGGINIKEASIDNKTKNAIFLIYVAIAYLATVYTGMLILFGSCDTSIILVTYFIISLVPLFIIFTVIWQYSFKLKLSSLIFDYNLHILQLEFYLLFSDII